MLRHNTKYSPEEGEDRTTHTLAIVILCLLAGTFKEKNISFFASCVAFFCLWTYSNY